MPGDRRLWCATHGLVLYTKKDATEHYDRYGHVQSFIPAAAVEEIKAEEREAILQYITVIGAEHAGKRKWNLILDDLARFIQERGQQPEEGKGNGNVSNS